MPQTREERLAKKRAYARAYRIAYPERLQAQKRAHRLAHLDKHKARDRAYRLAHAEELKRKKHDYYMAHQDKDKEMAYREANSERIKASNRKTRLKYAEKRKAQKRAYHQAIGAAKLKAYREAHGEEMRADARAYYAANREQHMAYARNHRARKYNAPVNDLTAAQWREIIEAYQHCCAYCGRTMQRLTQDHIIPLAKGGAHTASNIVPACRSCNSKKHTGPPLIPVQPLLLTIAPAKKKVS